MSDYTKATDFASKDALLTGNPSKLVKGTEIDTEFNNIATAVATKYDSADLGVTLQQYDADLAAIAVLAKVDGNIIVGDGSTWVAESGATARASLGAAALSANTFTGLQTFAAGADIASATTVDLDAATGNHVRITGTTATTGVTITRGPVFCYPTGAWPLTYHATTMPIKGGVDYTCAAGDTVIFSKDGNGTLHVDIFKADGTALVGANVKLAGDTVQVVEATPYTTYGSTASTIARDDTIPQNTEGAEWNTVTITPTSASNRLVIEGYFGLVAASGNAYITAALFQDSTADALAISSGALPNTYGTSLYIRHEMAAGTTSPTTFKLRAAVDVGTLYVNGAAAARKYGGTSAVLLSVKEIKV